MSEISKNKHHVRVLVVDNNTDVRELHKELLELWGHTAIIAEGLGRRLLDDARAKAHAYRCQLALVDVHLLDDYDHTDRSGLHLVEELKPAYAIMVSGSDDRKLVRDALVSERALDFVGKEDGPEPLKQSIDAVIQNKRLGIGHIDIQWPTEQHLLNNMLYDSSLHINENVICYFEELLAQLFPKAQKLELEPVVADAVTGERTSNLRRRSRVYIARMNDGEFRYVVKIAHGDKIQKDNDNYEIYVNNKLGGDFFPVREGERVVHWDLGGIVYRRVSAPALNDADPVRSFHEYFINESNREAIMQPIKHLFEQQWGQYYAAITIDNQTTLLDSYDLSWKNALLSKFEAWQSQQATMSFQGLQGQFPDPRYWLVKHHKKIRSIIVRKAVTHGDLHADNLFVNSQHAWPIDFERTGCGLVLRDAVELVQDLLTRIVACHALPKPVDIQRCYQLFMAVCISTQLAVIPTKCIPEDFVHAELFMRGLHFARDMQTLIRVVMRCVDIREYYWSLLLNNVYVAELIGEDNPRWQPTMLFASILCTRLEEIAVHNTHLWPPSDWPAITWLTEQEFNKQQKKKYNATMNTTIIQGDHNGPLMSGDFSGDVTIEPSQ